MLTDHTNHISHMSKHKLCEYSAYTMLIASIIHEMHTQIMLTISIIHVHQHVTTNTGYIKTYTIHINYIYNTTM